MLKKYACLAFLLGSALLLTGCTGSSGTTITPPDTSKLSTAPMEPPGSPAAGGAAKTGSGGAPKSLASPGNAPD